MNPAQVNLKSFSEPIAIYEKVIEAQVESKLFDDAMETFSKIKKANLHSLNASDVDISNSKNKAGIYFFSDLVCTFEGKVVKSIIFRSC